MVKTRGGRLGAARRFDTAGYLILGQLPPPLLATMRRVVDTADRSRGPGIDLHLLSCLHQYPELVGESPVPSPAKSG